MSKDIKDTTEADSSDDDNSEMQLLSSAYDDLEQGNHADRKPKAKMPDGLFQRLMLPLDQRFGFHTLLKVWSPRIEFVVRMMLVASFLDDSFHMAIHFSQHTTQVGEQGLGWLSAMSPIIGGVTTTVALAIGILAQLIGSICLVALIKTDEATKALIGWAIVQPVLYAQLSNFEFVAESVSLIGGLLLLRAHLVFEHARHGAGARTQLLGRLLLPTMNLYYIGPFLFSAFTLNETNSLATYIKSLSMFVVNTLLVVALMICCALVAAGLKSRLIAFVLALINLQYVFHNHPFFRYTWYEHGEWKYDLNMKIPHVALASSTSQLDFAMIYALHRYYFFLGISTSAALLLLAQFGPGEIAVQKKEILIPVVARAID